ncbi:hypothetical protein BASA81_011980 [Batrachochytrium salamandrivorans]|nr:hypothetical protein BASA81_011980 [Batrachochytrium salamandrivorans]
MKLAIASTTLLFAMMAAQATVLSVAPVTGVNLVKRAPNGGEDDEQSAMVDPFSSGLTFQDPLTEKKKSEWMIYMMPFVESWDSTRLYYYPEDISEYEELIKDLKKAL